MFHLSTLGKHFQKALGKEATIEEKTSLNPILPRQSLKNKIIEGTLLSANPKSFKTSANINSL